MNGLAPGILTILSEVSGRELSCCRFLLVCADKNLALLRPPPPGELAGFFGVLRSKFEGDLFEVVVPAEAKRFELSTSGLSPILFFNAILPEGCIETSSAL